MAILAATTPKQADVLIKLAAEAELFHAADGTSYADFEVNGHRETWAIRSKMFKRWLGRRFYEETSKAANSEAFQSAFNVIEAKSLFEDESSRFSSASVVAVEPVPRSLR